MARPPDPQALLVERDFVRALARGLLWDDADADDVAQDAWLAARRAREDANLRGGALRGWLAGITKNLTRAAWRARARRRAREERAARPERLPSAADLVEREALRRRVVEAVLMLEEPYQQVVLLRYFDELPPREVAAKLGIPVETARTRLKRALERLRGALDGEFGGERRAWSALLLPMAGAAAGEGAAKVGIAAAAVLVAALVGWWLLRPGGTGAPPGDGGGGEKLAFAEPSERRPAAAAAVGAGAQSQGSAARERAVDAKKTAIEGRVEDPAGRPVAGALVVGFPAARAKSIDPDAGSDPKEEVHSVRSAADGRFALPFAGPSLLFTVYAESGGFSPGCVPFARAGAEVVVRLGARVSMEGTVFDYQEKPIAGARVRWRALISGVARTREATTDAAGNYRIDGIATRNGVARDALQHASVVVEARGYATLVSHYGVDVDASGKPGRRDFYLGRGATLLGSVVDGETGAPIPGAAVVLWSIQGGYNLSPKLGVFPKNPFQSVILGEAKSDAAGAFRFDGIPVWGAQWTMARNANPYESTLGFAGASARGYARGAAEVLLPVEGETQRSTIRLWPAGTVRGKVVDGDGRAIGGIRVYRETELAASLEAYWGSPWDASDGYPNRSSKTNEAGEYSLEVESPRARAARVTIRAMGEWPLDEARTGEISVQLRAGETVSAPDLVVSPSGRRSARVVVLDPAGAPVAGALVCRDPFDSNTAAVTDSEGSAFLGFPPQKPDDLGPQARAWARVEGFALAASEEFVPSAAAPPDVVIRLAPGLSIAGAVLRADGSPASDVTVQLAKSAVAVDDVMGEWDDRNDAPPLPDDTFLAVTRTKEDGSFAFDGVADATYHLVATDTRLVYRPGLRRRDAQAAAPNVGAGSTGLLLRMPPLPASAQEKKADGILEVRVLDEATGGPAFRCDVRAIRGERQLSNMVARAPGKYRIVGVEPGEWLVRVYAPDCAPAEKKVVIEAGVPMSVVDVVVSGGIMLEGSVRDDAGATVRGGRVFLDAGPGIVGASGLLGLDGKYVVKGIQPNVTYRVAASGRTGGEGDALLYHLAGAGELAFPPGERSVSRDLVVVRASGLVVRVKCPRLPDGTYSPEVVTDEQKAASAASRLQVFDPRGKLVRTVQPLLQRGLETILPIATYRIRVEVAGSEPQEKTIALDPATRSNTVPFELP